MAKLKAARATDVVPPAMPEPDIAADLVGLAATTASSCSCIRGTTCGAEATTTTAEGRRPPLVVIGHRGKGMNALASEDGERSISDRFQARDSGSRALCFHSCIKMMS